MDHLAEHKLLHDYAADAEYSIATTFTTLSMNHRLNDSVPTGQWCFADNQAGKRHN
jgi:hypothetical protein